MDKKLALEGEILDIAQENKLMELARIKNQNNRIWFAAQDFSPERTI